MLALQSKTWKTEAACLFLQAIKLYVKGFPCHWMYTREKSKDVSSVHNQCTARFIEAVDLNSRSLHCKKQAEGERSLLEPYRNNPHSS